MNKDIVLSPNDKCTGCSVCAEICPKKCIKMAYVDSIHARPVIDTEQCIACGSCMNVCPALSKYAPTNIGQNYYMSWHLNDEERMSSTSGGAGAAFVSKAIKNGWYVCGASMDDTFTLTHIITHDAGNAKTLKGSKYLQSNMEGVYSHIKELTLTGNNVLFIGTPCQVEALNRYLPEKAKENVLTCGIICHGVNSPLVWNDFKNWLESYYNSKLIEYKFRSKSRGWQKKNGGPSLRISFKFKDGKEVDQPSWKNLFHWWFGHHYILRPSCFHCDYRTEYRNSDITIGDFWGVEKVNASADTYKGVSVVISSTQKGDSFVKSCDEIVIRQVDEEKTKKVLKGFVENRTPEKQSDEINKELSFEKEYLEMGFEIMKRKFPAETLLSRTKRVFLSKIGARK